MNLVPEYPGSTPNYWCTWGLQNNLAANNGQSSTFGFTGHSLNSSLLTEENLNRYIFSTDYLSVIRRDLYLLYDVGWDVPEGGMNDGTSCAGKGKLVRLGCAGGRYERWIQLPGKVKLVRLGCAGGQYERWNQLPGKGKLVFYMSTQ